VVQTQYKKIGLLNVLLAEGLNLDLSKMGEATNTHDYFQLSRLSSWHIESDAINNNFGTVMEAQSALPMSRLCGADVIRLQKWAILSGGPPRRDR